MLFAKENELFHTNYTTIFLVLHIHDSTCPQKEHERSMAETAESLLSKKFLKYF